MLFFLCSLPTRKFGELQFGAGGGYVLTLTHNCHPFTLLTWLRKRHRQCWHVSVTQPIITHGFGGNTIILYSCPVAMLPCGSPVCAVTADSLSWVMRRLLESYKSHFAPFSGFPAPSTPTAPSEPEHNLSEVVHKCTFLFSWMTFVKRRRNNEGLQKLFRCAFCGWHTCQPH